MVFFSKERAYYRFFPPHQQQNIHSSTKLVGLNRQLNFDLNWKHLKYLPLVFLTIPAYVVLVAFSS